MILQTVRVRKKDETCTFFVVNPHVYTLKTSAFTVCCLTYFEVVDNKAYNL